MKKNWTFFAIIYTYCFLCLNLNAQDKPIIRIYISDKTQTVQGEKFYVHTVEKGQTLYSIAIAYGVTIDEITKINFITDNLIGVGEDILIPFKSKLPKQEKTQPKTIENNYIFHQVEAGETLYSIAKKHNISINDIKTANPNLSENIKEKQIINIPNEDNKHIEGNKIAPPDTSSFVENDAYFIHTVKRKETLFSIANHYVVPIKDIIALNPEAENGLKIEQNLKIPKHIKFDNELKFVEVQLTDTLKSKPLKVFNDCKTLELKKELNVALFLPLYLSEVNNINTNFESHLYQRERHNTPKSFGHIQFYQGFALALDSLRKMGVSTNLHVFDLADNTETAKNVLLNPNMLKMDLIVGPFHENSFRIICNFAKENNITILNPEIIFNEKPLSYSKLINIPLPYQKQLEQYVRYLKTNHKKDNIILVHNNTSQEKNIIGIFKNHWNNLNHLDSTLKYNEVIYTQSALTGIMNNVKKNKNNLILCFSTNEAFVSNFIRKLSEIQNEQNNLILFGLPSWQRFSNLELAYLEKLKHHYFSTNYINYNDSLVKNFIGDFRENYAIEPNEQALLAYDLGLYFVYALHNYGDNFFDCINKIPIKPHTGLNFNFNSKTTTFDNEYLHFLRYEGFSVIKYN